MSNHDRSFTCYFCNKLIENESQVGHSTLCSKVLIPCPYKCGSYVQRANLPRHKLECTNHTNGRRISNNSEVSAGHSLHTVGFNSRTSSPKLYDDIQKLQQRFSELEHRLGSVTQKQNNQDSTKVPPFTNTSVDDIKSTLKQHAVLIQKSNYFAGFISEWKKNIDNQVASLKNTITSLENAKKDATTSWASAQDKLLYLQNIQTDLSLLKETVFKENAHFKNAQIDLGRNLEEIRITFNRQNAAFEKIWLQQTESVQLALKNTSNLEQIVEELKAKLAVLVIDLRSVSHLSSEANEKIEILDREFNNTRRDVNQMKVNMEILEDLSGADSIVYKRLIWRITDVESKLQRAKANDIVLKSPIFYTHQYGYKVRLLLYINGLKKWKDRYALACLHVLKGEYDPLLAWPCTIEGQIILRDLQDRTQPKNVTKNIKTKRKYGDEDEDEPQESALTYIFIPHSVLFKDTYMKDDTIFLDINVYDKSVKFETSF